MEPFEWLILGVGLAIGGLFGANSKGIMRSAAKGYLALEEKTKELTANMREDFRDAVEEARYEREQAEYEADLSTERLHSNTQALQEPPAARSRARGAAVSRPGARANNSTSKKTTRRKAPATTTRARGNEEQGQAQNPENA